MPQRLYLLDAMNLIFRSYHALSGRGFSTSRGEPTSATYGVAVVLLKILREEKPDYLAVLMDTGKPTFRHEKFPTYKSNRPATPDDLNVQMPRIRQVMEAMSLPVLQLDGYEADDIIAMLTRRARAEGVDVVIWSGDKDLLQLVGEGVTAVVPGRGVEETKTLDSAGVKEKLGVRPDQVVDFLALVGDSVDDIPGVPGVGPVTAAQLLTRFESVDELYARIGEVERATLREKLRAAEGDVRRNQELVAVHSEVPLEVTLESLRVQPMTRAKVMPVFHEIDSKRLIDLAAKLMPPDAAAAGERAPATATAPAAPGAPAGVGVSPAASDPRADSASPALMPNGVVLLRAARAGNALAVLPEARRSATGSVELEGFVLGTPAGLTLQVPRASVVEGGELYEDLRAALRDASLPKWSHDLKTLYRVLENASLPLQGAVFDADIARRMCEGTGDEEGGESSELEGDASGAETAATQTQLEFETGVPSSSAGSAGAPSPSLLDRARAVVRDTPELVRRVEAAGLGTLYHQVEVPLAEVLASMEAKGIAVDREELRRLSRDMGERIAALETEIHELAGGPFNINSTHQLKEVLFGKLGLSPGRRTRTGFSTDADVLSRLARSHPLPGLILRHRHLSKLRSTYAEALDELVNPATGRVHTTYNAMGASTGRISSRDPNLQNIPIRTEEGKAFRRVFVPGQPGWHLVSADYSQIELRILAHVTGEEGLIEAFHTGMDFHVATSATLLGIAPSEVTRQIRDRAKAVNYGIIYGMGARSLAQNLDIEEKEARQFIANYFARYPKVDRFIKGTLERARASGYVTTIGGRRCVFTELHNTRGDIRSMAERAAVNAVIQGSAADIMKIALVAIHRLLAETGSPARLLLTVHDEIVLEAPADDRLDALIARIIEGMRGAADLQVPLEVSAGHGANWLEAHG